jgi:hypothetical protein
MDTRDLRDSKDLFILHAKATPDLDFVRSYLLPALGLPPDRVVLSSSLPPGRPVLHAVECALLTSRVTVLVVSPAFLRETWSTCAEALASFHAMRGGLLVPLLISDCELPMRLELWVQLDFRFATRRADELARLRSLIKPLRGGTEQDADWDVARDAGPDEAVITLPAPLQPHPPSRHFTRFRISRARVAVAAMVAVLSCLTLLRTRYELSGDPLDAALTDPHATPHPGEPAATPTISAAPVETPKASPALHGELRPPPVAAKQRGSPNLASLMARGDTRRIREWLRQGKPYDLLMNDARVALLRRDYDRALRWGKLAADTLGDADAAWICAQAYLAQGRLDQAERYARLSAPDDCAKLAHPGRSPRLP